MAEETPEVKFKRITPKTSSRNWLKVWIVLGILAAGLVYFVYISFAPVYYYKVSEVVERGGEFQGRVVLVKGTLVPGSFTRDRESALASFTITDGRSTLAASYPRAVPDLFFNEHSEIVLEGNFTAQGIFVADEIRVKCPTKYQASYKAEGEQG